MADSKSVVLLQSYKSNNAGELCGFPASEADRLVKSGLAVFPQPAKKEPAAPVAKGPPKDKKVKAAPVAK